MCLHLSFSLPQVLCVNYCARVQGSSLKILLSRCRNLKCLMLQQTNLQSEHVMAAEWEKADQLQVSTTSAISQLCGSLPLVCQRIYWVVC